MTMFLRTCIGEWFTVPEDGKEEATYYVCFVAIAIIWFCFESRCIENPGEDSNIPINDTNAECVLFQALNML